MEKMTITRIDAGTPLTCDWDSPAWSDCPAGDLLYHMGTAPTHKPRVQFRLAYDADSLRLIFHVDDQYVRAVAENFHDAVCRDSCVEMFFTPGTDVAMGYFNFEFNCCGVMLARFQTAPATEMTDLTEADCCAVEILSSIEADGIDPEIAEPLTWTLAARIPLTVLEAYAPLVKMPAPGVTWRGNAYKCADKTSGPHWLTWSKIDWDGPNFHLPQFFGELTFS